MHIRSVAARKLLKMSGARSLRAKSRFFSALKALSEGLPPFPLERIRDVGAIFITHPHLDHFADMNAVTAACAAPVYVNARGMRIAREQGYDLPRFHPIGPGEERRVCGFTVRAYAGCHCLFDRPIVRETLRRSLRPEHLREGISIEKLNRRFRIDLYRDVLAYEIERGGKRLFLLGSANCRKNVAYPKQIDLMVYPYQGRSDMLAYSLRFLKRFAPRRVLLDHFDDAFPPVSSRMDCAPFVREAARRMPGVDVFAPVEQVFYEV